MTSLAVDRILHFLPTGSHADSSSVNSMAISPTLWSDLGFIGYDTYILFVAATMAPVKSMVCQPMGQRFLVLVPIVLTLASTDPLAQSMVSQSVDSIMNYLPTSFYTDSSSVNSMVISSTLSRSSLPLIFISLVGTAMVLPSSLCFVNQ